MELDETENAMSDKCDGETMSGYRKLRPQEQRNHRKTIAGYVTSSFPTFTRDKGTKTPSSSTSNDNLKSLTYDTCDLASENIVKTPTPLSPPGQTGLHDHIHHYDMVRVLGRGSAGKVLLVREKESLSLFALKTIHKKNIATNKEAMHAMEERKILESIRAIHHPFLAEMVHAFQNDRDLFIVLRYYSGGDLATHLAKQHMFPDDRTQFYAAEIICGLEGLHDRDIIYRDLKPENILLDATGHIVLTDFGLSKICDKYDQAVTFCGTPEYLAPELLKNEKYGREVDLWNLGVLIYEMTFATTPFWAETYQLMYWKVINLQVIPYPRIVYTELRNIIDGLLQRNPRKRLGYDSVGSLKSHPYFNNINWNKLYLKEMSPPFIPIMKLDTDVSNFDTCFTSERPELTPMATPSTSESFQRLFNGFSFDGNSNH